MRDRLRSLFSFAAIAFAICPLTVAQPTAGPKPINVSPAIAQTLVASQPMGTSIGQELRADGTVKVEFTIDAAGKVQDLASHPIAGASGGTEGAARNIVSHWSYHPYLLNGRPTPIRTSAIVEVHGNRGALKQ